MSTVAILLLLLRAASFVIIIDAVLSWVQGPDAFPRSLTMTMTAPLYAPIHAVLKPGSTGGLDLAPLIVLVLLQMLQGVVISAF